MEPTVQSLFDLSGRVALVTGGAGWLGRAICHALAEVGARVVVASRNLKRCQAVADELAAGALAFPLDVNDEAAVRRCVDRTVEEAGRIDVLVNNAYSGSRAGIDDSTSDDFQGAMRTGVTAYFIAAQQAVRHMRRQGGGGSIINNASMYGLVASYPDAYEGLDVNSPPNYHAVKGAVIHLTRHLAVYWAKDRIRVNAISPGPFPHDHVSTHQDEFLRRLTTKVPLGRMGEPHELKGAAVFLASEASSYMTGQNIVIDGGWTAW